MVDIITRDISSCDLKETVNRLIPDSMSLDIQKACQVRKATTYLNT